VFVSASLPTLASLSCRPATAPLPLLLLLLVGSLTICMAEAGSAQGVAQRLEQLMSV
jgi:hypothetical protein